FLSTSSEKLSLLPVAWLGLSLLVFATHKPWWPYYYPHLALPLSWCAAVGIAAAAQRLRSPRSRYPRFAVLGLALYLLAALPCLAGRLYLQITGIRNSPQSYCSLVLKEMARFKPFTEWLYADEPIYSFHSGIALPPNLAVVMLKRLWSGDMTNERIALEIARLKPGLILLKNDTQVVPFKDLLDKEYRPVYLDDVPRLYAHNPSRGRGA